MNTGHLAGGMRLDSPSLRVEGGDPGHAANAAVFPATDLERSMIGEVLFVDAGANIMAPVQGLPHLASPNCGRPPPTRAPDSYLTRVGHMGCTARNRWK